MMKRIFFYDVIPAEAGIQGHQAPFSVVPLDPRFRGDDNEWGR
jgi:hypothetical protein